MSDLHGAHIPDGALERANFAAVQFWTEDDWQAYEKAAKKNKPTRVGNQEGDEAEKFTGRFIENVDGSPVPKWRRLDMLKVLKKIFVILDTRGIAPSTWGRGASIEAQELVQTMMYKRYPELRLCHGDWKVEHLATAEYPNRNRGTKSDSAAKPEPLDVSIVKHDGDTVELKPTVKRALEDEQSSSVLSSKKPKLAPPVESTTATDQSNNSLLPNSSHPSPFDMAHTPSNVPQEDAELPEDSGCRHQAPLVSIARST